MFRQIKFENILKAILAIGVLFLLRLPSHSRRPRKWLKDATSRAAREMTRGIAKKPYHTHHTHTTHVLGIWHSLHRMRRDVVG